jgi:hypothetical protein
LSSAILYLAIVAIWACVLVPRWLHRSHDNHSGQETVSEQEEFAEFAEFAEGADPDQLVAEGAVGADPVAWEDPDAVPAGPVGTKESTVHAEYSSVSYSRTTLSVETVGAAEDLAGTADAVGDAYVADSAHTDYEAEYYAAAEAGPAPQDWSAAHAGPGRQQPRGPSRPPGRPPSRAHVLQARRRLLTMLVALTIGTAACTVAGFMPGWVLIVPIGLVGLYLMLLREVAQADAENARRCAEAHADFVRAADAQAMRERAPEAQAVPAPQPTAEVIDISAMAAPAGDQLYDQYTDAEIRAVGD